MRGVGNSVELVQLKGLRASLSQNAFVPCVAALFLLITVYHLSTHAMVPPKLKKRPIPLEDLQPRSLRDLHDQMVRGSIEMELPVKKEPETSWSLPNRVHFIWIGSVIKDKYVNNINNFCNHNPEYQVSIHFNSFMNSYTSQSQFFVVCCEVFSSHSNNGLC